MTEDARRYSVDEVNAALPSVMARFEAVMQLRTQLKTLYTSLEDAGHPPGQHAPPDAAARVVRDRAVFDGMAEALREQVAAISETGCVIRDIEIGLCDWRGDHEGREVWLCWQYGEAVLGWFHELDTGFAGRRPVGELRPRRSA
jgi:hypothetical protein